MLLIYEIVLKLLKDSQADRQNAGMYVVDQDVW